jgi:hypothetical protein
MKKKEKGRGWKERKEVKKEGKGSGKKGREGNEKEGKGMERKEGSQEERKGEWKEGKKKRKGVKEGKGREKKGGSTVLVQSAFDAPFPDPPLFLLKMKNTYKRDGRKRGRKVESVQRSEAKGRKALRKICYIYIYIYIYIILYLNI